MASLPNRFHYLALTKMTKNNLPVTFLFLRNGLRPCTMFPSILRFRGRWGDSPLRSVWFSDSLSGRPFLTFVFSFFFISSALPILIIVYYYRTISGRQWKEYWTRSSSGTPASIIRIRSRPVHHPCRFRKTVRSVFDLVRFFSGFFFVLFRLLICLFVCFFLYTCRYC